MAGLDFVHINHLGTPDRNLAQTVIALWTLQGPTGTRNQQPMASFYSREIHAHLKPKIKSCLDTLRVLQKKAIKAMYTC